MRASARRAGAVESATDTFTGYESSNDPFCVTKAVLRGEGGRQHKVFQEGKRKDKFHRWASKPDRKIRRAGRARDTQNLINAVPATKMPRTSYIQPAMVALNLGDSIATVVGCDVVERSFIKALVSLLRRDCKCASADLAASSPSSKTHMFGMDICQRVRV